MTYEQQRELIEGLRGLIDDLENNIELPLDFDPEVKLNVWLYDDDRYFKGENPRTAREKLAIAARCMGKADKIHNGGYFDLVKNYGKYVKLEYTINRNAVCKRIVTEVVEHPEEIVPAKIIPARTEEVVEWVCDEPILTN